MDIDSSVVDWLLEGDSAIRWQTMRDLLDRNPSTVRGERARVATTGWGKRLLDEQDPEGTWAQGSIIRSKVDLHSLHAAIAAKAGFSAGQSSR